MRILAFDPGHTTGFALIEDGKILICGIVDRTFGYIFALSSMMNPDLIVIEDIPTRDIDKSTLEMFETIKRGGLIASKKLLVVKPGQWKPLQRGKEQKFIHHVQDAIGLAQYAERVSKDE